MHPTWRHFFSASICLLLTSGPTAFGAGHASDDTGSEVESASETPPPTNLHLFLLAGQSNMAGRGKIEEQDLQPHPRVLMLNKEGHFVPAVAPVHFDKPGIAGVGLGRTFAIEYANAHPEATVGLIPTAAGGSSLEAWQPNGFHAQTKSHPYDDCLQRMQQAMQAGELKGILWHQGESDSSPERAQDYQAELDDLFLRFRREFHSPDVPILVGQLGQFPERPWNEFRKLVDQAHRTLPERMTNTAFVVSDDLTHKGDQVHFSAEAYREFGRRYYRAFQTLEQSTRE
ncbi:sialate O-acetylesterase [Rhodopirellula sp. P2]|uniref:sialate O-acetylesterase n=1 Tax=Rhodopirellula sp. P2 TaxID=2127060 RepID=UPI002367AF96|nr:sialate O-acetylesterase [Rhodopirellula sp. P2]WDQ14735.1 sialate O-acetylesterase [Rhodopirellula sp. P2]